MNNEFIIGVLAILFVAVVAILAGSIADTRKRRDIERKINRIASR